MTTLNLGALKDLLAAALLDWRWFPNFKQNGGGFVAKWDFGVGS